MSDQTLRVFLSSTAIDMVHHRKKVSEALLKLENLPVRMESFGAVPSEPVDLCKEKVRSSNALVVMIAQRYGWVPTKEEGGDGKKSITWIEVETALENNIPVFAFVIDEKYPWAQPTEESLLKNAKDDKEALSIYAKVRGLQDFKTFIDTKAGVVRDRFTTPDALALHVITALSKWFNNSGPIKDKLSDANEIPIVFREVHHLQPALHFRGRQKLLLELKKWWDESVTPDRVRSLVAIGGTGKTAIAQRFIESIKSEKPKGSVLVWSFYDDPNTDSFIKEACITFTGKEPEGVGGRLEYLQRALSISHRQNLIILDGLERVQSEGKGSQHAKGDLEDHRLKNLLRAIAAGIGNTRALITSRFKLNDLTQWERAGYRSYELEVLDPETAIEVLRAWGVIGTNEELNKLIKSIGYHALSVSVLGSYLNHYYGGNIDGAREFRLDELSVDDTQAARLGRILGGYAKNLSDAERDLLIRLSVFPNGVSVNILFYIIDAGGAIAGAMTGFTQHKLLITAERLKQQGLIYSYFKEGAIIYTSHPFLRDYFRSLLNVKPENIHEVVVNKLAVGLDTKPETKPIEIETLDKYEQLIEHSILAGHYKYAYTLYRNTMGGGVGNDHLFHVLCDYGRIVRILSLFTKDGTPETLLSELDSDENRRVFLSIWGLAASSLGDLKMASICFELSIKNSRDSGEELNLAQCYQNTAALEIAQGNFMLAKRHLEESQFYCSSQEEKEGGGIYFKYVLYNTLCFKAYTLHLVGQNSEVITLFKKAKDIYKCGLFSLPAFFEISFYIRLGNINEAEKRAIENEKNTIAKSGIDITREHYQFGILSLKKSVSEARTHLDKLREWTDNTGHVQCIILGYILASNIAFVSGDYPTALSEAQSGLNQAESCGYNQYVIDISLLLAKIHLAIPDHTTALGHARKAFERSAHPDCQYAWGEADGLHLSGVCHLGLGEYELANQRFNAALVIREKIQHPDIDETRGFLAELRKRN
jgi:tetratricopeptide (TPR) repeat protein